MHSQPWHVDGKHTVLIGLDLGTSGLKGVAVDFNGYVIARGQALYDTNRIEPGASEQDPIDWLDACESVIRQLSEQIPIELWAGVGLSGMIPTLVCLDDELNSVGAAITWEDGRADEYGKRFRAKIGEKVLYEKTGQWVDGRYLIPMWQRICELELARVEKTMMISSAKDFVFGALTGVVETDPSTATGFGCYRLIDGSWDEEIISASEIKVNLPNVVPSTSSRPVIHSASLRFSLPEGLPICLGAADSVLGALGMGVEAAGQIAYVAGTSTVILGIATQILIDSKHRFIVTPMAYPGTWGLEMDLLSTGGAIRWLSALFGEESESTALELASQSETLEIPCFLPYLAPGEQGALWDSKLSGAIVGLELSHTKGDLMKSLVHGILFESWRCLAVLEEFGFKRETISVAGGSVLNPWFRQQLADVSQRDVIAPIDGDSDYSAIGAAIVLSTTLGIEIQKTSSRTLKVVPNPKSESIWRENFTQFEGIRTLL